MTLFPFFPRMENRWDILGRFNSDLEKFYRDRYASLCRIIDLKELLRLKESRGKANVVDHFCELKEKTNCILEIVSKNHTTYSKRRND